MVGQLVCPFVGWVVFHFFGRFLRYASNKHFWRTIKCGAHSINDLFITVDCPGPVWFTVSRRLQSTRAAGAGAAVSLNTANLSHNNANLAKHWCEAIAKHCNSLPAPDLPTSLPPGWSRLTHCLGRLRPQGAGRRTLVTSLPPRHARHHCRGASHVAKYFAKRCENQARTGRPGDRLVRPGAAAARG